MHLCFRGGLGASLAAVSLMAAGLPERPQQITRVVRADPRTGKLVRSVIVTSKPAGPRQVTQTAALAYANAATPAAPALDPAIHPASLDEAVEQIAAQYALRSNLIHSVIKVESNYNPFAVSPKGAMGLMQLMPETARRFGVADVFNPIDNIQGGAKYLRYLLDLYNENYPLALAAYNAGERAVEKYGTIPPYQETRNYVVLVRRAIEQAEQAAAAAAKNTAPAPVPAKPVESGPAEPAHIREVLGADGIVRYVTR